LKIILNSSSGFISTENYVKGRIGAIIISLFIPY